MADEATQTLIEQYFSGSLPPDQDKALLERLLRNGPATSQSFLSMMMNERRALTTALHEGQAAFTALAQKLNEPPLQAAVFLRTIGADAGRALVVSGRGRASVAIASDVDRNQLHPGRYVFLSANGAVLVDVAPAGCLNTGAVGEFSRYHGSRAVVLGPADEEILLDLSEELIGDGLKSGDAILYDREAQVALEKISSRHQQKQLLEEMTSKIRLCDLGGLDDVFHEIYDEVLLSLVVLEHQMDLTHGITLFGPPGVGKTSLVCALGNELKEDLGLQLRCFVFRPSSHRSEWYGRTEANLHAMFDQIRAAAAAGAYVLALLDDADHFGSRDTYNDVDARVLPALLHEIESLQDCPRVLLIAASNRPDMIDPALLRAGRLGDRQFKIPRPGTRDGARAILRCYLKPELPYAVNGHGAGAAACAGIIEDAVSAMFAPNGALAVLATLHYRDNSTQPLTPAMLLSGALLKSAAGGAKRRSALRKVSGAPAGISAGDLIGALEESFHSTVGRLRPGHELRELLDLPPDLDVMRISLPASRQSAQRRYMYA